MTKIKFSDGGYTGAIIKDSTVGIIQNTGCCFGLDLDKKSILDKTNRESGVEIKTTIITINDDGTMSKNRGLDMKKLDDGYGISDGYGIGACL